MFAWPGVSLLLLLQGGVARPLVSVDVRPETVSVGQPFTVRVRVRSAPGATIRFPSVPDSAASVEAVDPRAVEDHSDGTVRDQTAIYRFTAWEPGLRTVPLADVRWEQARGVESLPLGAVRVVVTSMLPVDTAQQTPREARDAFDAPRTWWRLLLAAFALLVLALFWWRHRRHAHKARPAADAFVDAQAAFAAVDQLALDDAGEPGRAVLAYAEIMREYLTRRFPMATDGLTTPEYVQTLADNALPILPEEVLGVLVRADEVKFAGARISADDVKALARLARGIVRDVQTAYEVRLAAADKGPQGRRRGRR